MGQQETAAERPETIENEDRERETNEKEKPETRENETEVLENNLPAIHEHDNEDFVSK